MALLALSLPPAKPLGASHIRRMKAMSNDINQFLQTMVEAKAAIDQLPSLQRRLVELERANHIQGETIANRELHIHNLKQSESSLTQKLRSVEAERDDAGFRHLESEDKVQSLLSNLRHLVATSLETISAVNGEGLVVVTAEDKAELTRSRVDVTHLSTEVTRLSYDCDSLRTDVGRISNERDQAIMTVAKMQEALDEATRQALQHDKLWDAPGYVVQSAAPSSAYAPDGTASPGEQQVRMYQAAIDQHAGGEGQSEPDPTSATTPQDAGPSSAPPTAIPSDTASLTTTQLETEVPAQPSGPFAASSHGEASGTAGEGVKGDVSSAAEGNFHTKLPPHPDRKEPPSDDYWPQASRASHNS